MFGDLVRVYKHAFRHRVRAFSKCVLVNWGLHAKNGMYFRWYVSIGHVSALLGRVSLPKCVPIGPVVVWEGLRADLARTLGAGECTCWCTLIGSQGMCWFGTYPGVPREREGGREGMSDWHTLIGIDWSQNVCLRTHIDYRKYMPIWHVPWELGRGRIWLTCPIGGQDTCW